MNNDRLGVRAASAAVASRSRAVAVDDDALSRLVDRLAQAGADAMEPSADLSYFFVGSPEDTVAYVLTFTAVNFGSGWHPHVEKLPGRSGSMTMMARLTERFRHHGPLTGDELRTMTASSAAALFGQRLDPPIGELMALFARAWNELGDLLIDRFDDRLVAVVEDADHSAIALAEILLAMPLFRDISVHDGEPVPLLKRAQIAAADLATVLSEHRLGRFDDLDELTIFADNLVPHVLRVDGVLRYDHELSSAVDGGDLLVAGSPAEVEIRANAVWAVERLVAMLRDRGLVISAATVDQYLWSIGHEPHYKAVPRHRCRTSYY